MVESEIYQWLSTRQIAVPEYKVFSIDEEPCINFFPVAIKIQSPKVVHKSDVGGVAINLDNINDLKNARLQILANLARNGIYADGGDTFIVTRMQKGIELFFGVINDPVFDKVIVFGAGGIYAELFKDICFIDTEADDDEIARAIQQTKISIIFTKGFRGKKYNIQLVVDLIKKLQQLDVQELDLNPVILQEDMLTVVDARLAGNAIPVVHKKIKDAPGLFAPGKTAIIGVSAHPGKVGFALAKNTAENGDVYYVNPGLDTLFGKKVYNSIEELPLIDTAVIAIPACAVKDTVEKLADKNVKNIIVITAGFKEAGEDEYFLTSLAQQLGLNIIGPNCLGVYAGGVNLSFGATTINSGNLNLFSQSGAIAAELMDKAALKNIGFENIISTGNMADVDFADLVNSYTGTNPVNLYVEGVSNGKNLLRAIRNSKAAIKIFKAGKTELAKRAAFSHTGNMAGNYEMFNSLLTGAGAHMLKDVNGLLYPYNFNKILVITNAGGPGTVISDLCGDKLHKLTDDDIALFNAVLPPHWSHNNPVDIIGDAGADRFLKALKVADTLPVDAVYVIITPQFMTDVMAIARMFAAEKFSKSMFPVLLGGKIMQPAKTYLQNNGIAFFEELSEAVCFL